MSLLITGAAGGIGYAAARRMAKQMTVILADLDEDRVSEFAGHINREGYDAYSVQVDVTSATSVKSMMDWISRRVGPVHALFNNAGIMRRATAEKISEVDWDLVLDTHVKGTYLCSQAVLPQMCQRKQGVIVNMSSDYAVMATPDSAAYSAAKTAVYTLTKCLALEFSPYGIRVNALGPGPIDTPLLRSGRGTIEEWPKIQKKLEEGVPMGRLGRPDEVASVLDFLLSERSSYMTGQIIHLNGGQLIL